MATLDQVLQKQKTDNILQTPASSATAGAVNFVAATDSTLSVSLVNNTTSSTVYAYVTGLAIDNDNAVYLLESDGQTAYYPSSPSSDSTPLSEDCSIALGAPGNTVTITIPRTAGGRIWFAKDSTLNFYLNPGPGLVEPSIFDYRWSDLDWCFCEYTFNSSELFINISSVDFVSLPIGLSLTNSSGTTTTVEGLPANGLDTICSALKSQTASDGSNWSDLIVTSSDGSNLRALSPNSGITINSSLFSTYYDSYVSQVWSKYSDSTLTVDTQASWGSVSGTVQDDELSFGTSVGSFSKPSSANIFSCSSGPFATSTDEMANIGARLAAAFNRSTLLIDANTPEGEVVSKYYTNAITNHYARILHETFLDGKGYAFPYDDVGPANGVDQSGSLYDANPASLTVTVGGPSSSSSSTVRRGSSVRRGQASQRIAGRKQAQHQRSRRDSGWVANEDEDEEQCPSVANDDTPSSSIIHAAGGDDDNDGEGKENSEVDLEKGLGRGKQKREFDYDFNNEVSASKSSGGGPFDKKLTSSRPIMARSLRSLVPHTWADRITSSLAPRLEAVSSSPAKPVVDMVVRLLGMVLRLSVGTLVSRVTVALFLVLFYFVLPLFVTTTAGRRNPGAVGDTVQIEAMTDAGLLKAMLEDGLDMTLGLGE